MILADYHLPRALRPVAAQAARVVCPDDLETLGLTDAVVAHFELSLRALPAHVRAGVVAGLIALELLSPLYPGAPGRRFSRLPLAAARAWFDTWWDSPFFLVRRAAFGVKAFLAFAYYEQPAVRAKIGYYPEAWVAAASRRRLEKYGDEIRRREAELLRPSVLLRQRARRAQAS